ncbi:MAG: hypothetical protein GY707_19695, partial [Desulfobacteraceae bacterium]|nr:hypothetical protein [Desulfobacteraceae bacterium]
PLTATRTLGALGGIVASRIAREFKFGGPCFTVSAGNSSGLKAIDIGIKSLRSGETKVFLCGSVDMASDVRQILINKSLTPFEKNSSENILSEGAGAVVLKTLTQAKKDNDKIYGLIKGTGHASAGELRCERDLNSKRIQEAYQLSLKRCLKNSSIKYEDIDHYELNSDSNDLEDKIETNALKDYLKKYSLSNSKINYGSASSLVGDTNGVSSLIAFIKSALFLKNKTLSSNTDEVGNSDQTCIASISDDGSCSHMIIEEFISNQNIDDKRDVDQTLLNLDLNPDLIIKSA